MAATTDRRALRTRERLVEAFIALAARNTVPTVAEVIARSNVNRTTFYAHYATIDDLAVEALGDVFDLVGVSYAAQRRHGRPSEASAESLAEVAGFLGDRRAVYAHLLERDAFAQTVEDAFVARNIETFRSVAAHSPELLGDVDIEVASRFVAAGVLGVIAAWLRAPTDADADTLARRIAALLPPALRGPQAGA